MNKMYLVKYVAGRYEDYAEYNVFVTVDKQIAEQWVDRFNTLIDRVKKKLDSIGPFDDAPDCFWSGFVQYDGPCAQIEEIDVRPQTNKL